MTNDIMDLKTLAAERLDLVSSAVRRSSAYR